MTKQGVIQVLGIEKASQELQDQVLDNISKAVSARTMSRISQRLTDDDLDKLAELIDADNEEEVEKYIRSKIDDYDSFITLIEEEVISEIVINKKIVEDKYNQKSKPPS